MNLYDKLREHVGHDITCVHYGNINNISIQCEDCMQVILEDTEMSGGSSKSVDTAPVDPAVALAAVDSMDVLCSKGREQVKQLLRTLYPELGSSIGGDSELGKPLDVEYSRVYYCVEPSNSDGIISGPGRRIYVNQAALHYAAYPTTELAASRGRYETVLRKLERIAQQLAQRDGLGDGWNWEPEWGRDKELYYNYYDSHHNKWYTSSTSRFHYPGHVYFHSIKSARAALESLTEEEKVILLTRGRGRC